MYHSGYSLERLLYLPQKAPVKVVEDCITLYTDNGKFLCQNFYLLTYQLKSIQFQKELDFVALSRDEK